VSDFLGPAQQALNKPKGLAQGLDVIVGFGQRMRQTCFEQPNPAASVQE
jgi:hypothetical protein